MVQVRSTSGRTAATVQRAADLFTLVADD